MDHDMTEKLARDIREALGPLNDDNEPVIMCVRKAAAECQRLTEIRGRLTDALIGAEQSLDAMGDMSDRRVSPDAWEESLAPFALAKAKAALKDVLPSRVNSDPDNPNKNAPNP